jgi:hypothetical protein
MSQENNKAAEEFVKNTAAQLQKSFRNTLIAAVVILTIESIYFTVLNNKIAEGLTAIPVMVDSYRGDFDKIKELANKIPDRSSYENSLTQVEGYLDRINKGSGEVEGVANLVSQKIVAELDYQGHMVSSTASKYLKENLTDLPEWVEKRIPKYGSSLRFKIDGWMHYYCQSASDGLGSTFDTFLDDNADKIRKFSEAADDEDTLDKLDEELTLGLVEFIKTVPIEKYGTLKSQADELKRRLEAANDLLRPLAYNETKDLNKQQLRLRSAVALFMDKVNKGQNN